MLEGIRQEASCAHRCGWGLLLRGWVLLVLLFFLAHGGRSDHREPSGGSGTMVMELLGDPSPDLVMDQVDPCLGMPEWLPSPLFREGAQAKPQAPDLEQRVPPPRMPAA